MGLEHRRFCSSVRTRLSVSDTLTESHTSSYLILLSIAIDIWAAGVILLSFMACKFPIFYANDDVEALMEIAAVVGRRKMEKCAQLHSRSFSFLNLPSAFTETKRRPNVHDQRTVGIQ